MGSAIHKLFWLLVTVQNSFEPLNLTTLPLISSPHKSNFCYFLNLPITATIGKL